MQRATDELRAAGPPRYCRMKFSVCKTPVDTQRYETPVLPWPGEEDRGRQSLQRLHVSLTSKASTALQPHSTLFNR
jgi:hypothetical protein